MNCIDCGSEMVHETRSVPYAYKGQSTTIDGVTGDFCVECGEMLLDSAQAQAFSEKALAFNKVVNSAVIAPEFITRVREKLGLNGREAAEIFGGGVNAFSRYETGKAAPSVPLMHLLKILDLHPDLLAEIAPQTAGQKAKASTTLAYAYRRTRAWSRAHAARPETKHMGSQLSEYLKKFVDVAAAESSNTKERIAIQVEAHAAPHNTFRNSRFVSKPVRFTQGVLTAG